MNAIRQAEGMVIAVSADPVDDLRNLAQRHDLEFTLLADPELEAIDAYGLRHENGGPYGDVARPATFILDREGRVVWRDLSENWRVRPRPEMLVAELEKIP